MSFDSGRKPADELDLLVGSTVAGKYHVDRLIGRGGMGAVFQATNAGIGKRVALKFLGAETSRDEGAATRFQREAEAASLAESPHIVQIFDSGRSEQGLPFLVMELLTGEDLRARLRREGRLAPGIVHRDLKPDNVFLCQRDDEPAFVKIVDFGISKLQQAKHVDTLTHKGAVLGTAYYMSPEQAQSFPDIDGRTDLFSVGAILYEMLTGEPPHSAPTYEAVLIAICTRDADDVRGKRERAERYQSAVEMLEDLDAAMRESGALSALTRKSGGVWVEAPKSQTGQDRFRTLVFAIVAALGGFALAAYFVARGAARPVEPLAAPEPPAGSVLPPLGAASAPLPPPASARPAAPSKPTAPSSKPSAPLPKAVTRPATNTQKPGVQPTKPAEKNPPATRPAGVASGLGLSTREP
jgi:hypothetical protein